MENQNLPVALYTIAQSRELDKIAAAQAGLGDGQLMERAGMAAYHALRELWPAAHHITVVTGAGNNGGDGFVLARLAHENKLAVEILTLTAPEKLTGDALNAYQLAEKAGVLIHPWQEDRLHMADVIVDAIFGIGLQRKADGLFADAIEAINAADSPVLALDIPSGLSADSGRVQGVAVRADVTITFIAIKEGLTTGDAADHVGELIFNDLGVPDFVYEKVKPSAYRAHYEQIQAALPKRSRNSHKGHFGHVLVIGGDLGYGGAAGMAALGALRTGAGLVSVATRHEHIAALVAMHPEIMAHGVTRAEELVPLIEKATVIVLGPGLGRTDWSHALWTQAISTHLPMVVDADGLNYLADDPHVSRDWVLTPHIGEAARLLKTQGERVQLDRFGSAKALQHEYGGVAVLKGSGSIIQGEEEAPYVCMAGNPGMATGGMGDILSGVIAGLLAQNVPLLQAASIGVYIHARAADLAAREGERGLLATNLLPYIRQLVNPA